MICQLVFAEGSEIISSQYMDGVLIIQHADKTLFSVVKIGKMKESNKTPQFMQLNLLSMPSLTGHQGEFNFEMHKKRLNQGKI